ncbi:Suppressor of F exclusion of phage T7 [Thalassovita autumnalis]|uniref:Suppressor of F exclusion of phage T7 n=1 Tax=Thalassovita autumnalis TaxID=2072972 RepID=A0A0P1FUF2_9RHOB|nr:FxsA family protein [Thalassovita autumnalis]CUH66306.1 Suppressor of F exclusion of phage T7 [Thalassovita autumnalis]CUH72587.1 Suppressor of F exclusion of phage T7 [Thalassovita autumnalis]
MWLLFAFIGVPIIEIALFIQVGGAIGTPLTLLIVVLTAILGTYMVRQQGRLAIGNLQRSFSELNDPTEPLAHGAMVLISGVLLLTPGFFTDALGFALLVPAIRSAVFRYAKSRVKVQTFSMGGSSQGMGHAAPHHDASSAAEDVIDGEFTEVDPNKRATHQPSVWTKH